MFSVFPAAVGRLVVAVKFSRPPGTQADQRALSLAALAYLRTSLESPLVSPLVASLRYSRNLYSDPELVLLVTPSAKWGKHFTLEVSLAISGQSQAEDNLQSQLDLLTSQQPYLAASAGRKLWLLLSPSNS